jgi:type I restriction enzyme S subunit
MKFQFIKVKKAFEFIRNGKSIKQTGTTGIPVTRIETIANGYIDFDKMGYADIESINVFKKYQLKIGDILMSHINSEKHLGKVALYTSSKTVIHGMNLLCLRPKENLSSKYAFYYFKTFHFKNQLAKITKKSVNQASFSVGAINDIQIPLPPLETQKKIVNILDKAQELIDKRKQQIDLMDSLVQSLFYDMFGDPVLNPMGWEKGRIKDIAKKTQYGTSKKAHESKGAYPILRMNNITYSGHWNFDNLKFIDFDEKEKQKYLVYKNEILFNRTNSKELVGKTAVYKEEKPMAFAGYLVKLIVNEKANPDYISAYLNSKHGKAFLLSKAKSIVGMANINAEELKKFTILIPPITLQNNFAEKVEKIETQKQKMQKSLKDLEQNFSSLMQKAFKGEI